MSNLRKHINEACRAQAHLYVFASVIGVLEGGAISGCGSADKTAQKIIKLCNLEMQKQLRLTDAAIEAAHAKGAA